MDVTRSLQSRQNKMSMDGCTAATHVAYALSEVATIYPITPIASMGEVADKWALAGRKNIFGSEMEVKEMESELGAAAATHGALAAGALATTFTASQGLMLMIPNMYKIAGEQLPAVFHVGCRSLASHALSIFGDHQDVMACRATGFVMLASSSVQETMDLALVAHMAAIEGSLPVLHFFDGWRTSNERATIDVIPYESMAPLVDMDKVTAFRGRAMNPEHPSLRGTSQGSDVYFQCREAGNSAYDAMPAIVQRAMDRVGELTGRNYHTVDYHGATDAEWVMMSMGSSAQVIAETVDYLNGKGYKVGCVNVRLYRPFPADKLMKVLPVTVKHIAVMDRTKEPGAYGEPLYLDVASALQSAERAVKISGGRYGLSSKEFDPAMVKAVFDAMKGGSLKRQFTVGIEDDVTHLSIPVAPFTIPEAQSGLTQVIFYGIGSDGTVGATKQLADILAEVTGGYSQAYFNYSAKKSGGYTISQLRFGARPVTAEYGIEQADYVGCNKSVYVKRYELVDRLREGGVFVLNSPWNEAQLETELPAALKRKIATKGARFYNVDANSLAEKGGLGVRINTIMAAVFIHLMDGHVPADAALAAFKEQVKVAYKHEGGAVVARNLAVIDEAAEAIKEISYPSSWAVARDEVQSSDEKVPAFVKDVAQPCLKLLGNELPVSKFAPDGTLPMGTTAYEKRRIAINIPVWDAEKCVECTECSLVCPHAAIRPYLLDEAENAAKPASMTTVQGRGAGLDGMFYRIQVYPADCLGCGSCAVICPGKALEMTPIDSVFDREKECLDYLTSHVGVKATSVPRDTVRGSQLRQPLLEFSGACAGCGETPYVKLLTQLFGERMIVANATGCSSIWGASYPSNPYCTDAQGRGPAWGNSLFEDNAEYGYGMLCAVSVRRPNLRKRVEAMVADSSTAAEVRDAAQEWIDAYGSATGSAAAAAKLLAAIGDNPSTDVEKGIVDERDLLVKKSVWAIGGDGWAYDIDFGGLDHVLAQDVDINILVMDTECYSNTGGQTSKATPLGAVMKYSADGKRTYKKDLGRMMMTYGNIYVASIALGANYQQAVTALAEAEAYPGPSLVIAYCPCINHGIRAGMSHSIVEERLAVRAGYWPLYRFNPALERPLTVDCATPDGTLITFINGEDRYADLKMTDPSEASILQPDLKNRCDHIHSLLVGLAQQKNDKS